MEPIPVHRYLAPPPITSVPSGFTLVDERLARGLPHTIQLDKTISLTLAIARGLAADWRECDPAAIVSTSEADFAARIGEPEEEVGATGRAAIQLLVRKEGSTVGTVPLVAGRVVSAPNPGTSQQGALVQLVILSWDVRAGSVRGPGDFGARLRLAWRRADRGVDEFAPPPPHPYLVQRLPAELRFFSDARQSTALGSMGLAGVPR
jgi:hypothetical protein